jgi:hypothetical protein
VKTGPGDVTTAAAPNDIERMRPWILAPAICRSTTMTGCPPSPNLNPISAMNRRTRLRWSLGFRRPPASRLRREACCSARVRKPR